MTSDSIFNENKCYLKSFWIYPTWDLLRKAISIVNIFIVARVFNGSLFSNVCGMPWHQMVCDVRPWIKSVGFVRRCLIFLCSKAFHWTCKNYFSRKSHIHPFLHICLHDEVFWNASYREWVIHSNQKWLITSIDALWENIFQRMHPSDFKS